MALSETDRNLLQACLQRKPRAWENFVDRFLGIVIHAISRTAQSGSLRLGAQDREDLTSEVFLALVSDDLAALRRFRGQSSLATYLTVIARRVIVHELLKRKMVSNAVDATAPGGLASRRIPGAEERISNREEVARLLRRLHGPEVDVIRMFYLEGKSYREISSSVGMPENSIGPTLSRARAKMRQSRVDAVGD